MTLKEMKYKTLKLIEEVSSDITKYTDDPDIDLKINDVINQIQYELARIKKIPAKMEYEVEDEDTRIFTMTDDMYQIYRITGSDNGFDIIGKEVIFPDDFTGTVNIYYYKYPERIKSNTNENYQFELSDEVLEIMPYGVAGDILKSDVSNAYGNIYSQRYESMKQQLDPRFNMGFIEIGEGI